MKTSSSTPLFDQSLAVYLTQLGQMADYFDKRYMAAVKAKRNDDPLIEQGIYDDVTDGIYAAQEAISRLIGTEVRINTFTKELKENERDNEKERHRKEDQGSNQEQV